MSPDNTTPGDPLDRAIDQALRDLMRADTSGAFTRDVMARIETASGFGVRGSGSDGSRARTWWPVFAAGAAAVVLLVAAIWSFGTRTMPRVSPAPQAARDATPPARTEPSPLPPSPEATSAGAARDTERTASANAVKSSARHAAAARTIELEQVAALEPTLAIDALPALPPIAIESIAPKDMPMETLDLPKLEIAPLDLESSSSGSKPPVR